MNNTMIYPASLLCDFYKVSHKDQYPIGTEKVYSTWTPRTSRKEGIDKVICFGVQAFIKKYLMQYFDEYFFKRDEDEVAVEYEEFLKYTLGLETVDSTHIRELHQLGYLPVKIKAVKEGTGVPIRVPMLTIENTHQKFFWITNYLETLMSCELWLPMTSATIALQYRKIVEKYAKETNGDLSGVPFQCHDFSMRGMASLEAAILSGAGHILSFTGTDTIPSIKFMEYYYNGDMKKELIATSIPATEHSVMCTYGDADEIGTFRDLLTRIYPSGFFSVVSDTWDLWRVLTKYLPELKEEVMSRDGRCVIRPDSGDPVKIICGDDSYPEGSPQYKGVIQLLWETFGGTETEMGYKQLDSHIGAIYGDSITPERAIQICEGLKAKGFASTNIVFGVGSYTYQYNTRDTFGFALKATYAVVNGEERKLFKDPITDNGTKKSQKGLVAVVKAYGELRLVDDLDEELYNKSYASVDELEVVFEDGELIRDESLAEIRSRVAENF